MTYCAICDGPLFSGQKVAVIGGGNSALEAADDMVKIAQHVYLVSLTSVTGDQILIEKVKDALNLTLFLEHEVLEIEGPNSVEAILIRDLKSGEEKRLFVSGIFIEIGLLPNSKFTGGIARLNKFGEISETGLPGLFAAGNVTNVMETNVTDKGYILT